MIWSFSWFEFLAIDSAVFCFYLKCIRPSTLFWIYYFMEAYLEPSSKFMMVLISEKVNRFHLSSILAKIFNDVKQSWILYYQGWIISILNKKWHAKFFFIIYRWSRENSNFSSMKLRTYSRLMRDHARKYDSYLWHSNNWRHSVDHSETMIILPVIKCYTQKTLWQVYYHLPKSLLGATFYNLELLAVS